MRISEKTYTKYKTQYWEENRGKVLDAIKDMSKDEIADHILDIEWNFSRNAYVSVMRKLEKASGV